MEVTKFWLIMFSGDYLLVAVKVASSIFVNQLNAKNDKPSKTQFKFQFKLSMNITQLSPSLSLLFLQTTPKVWSDSSHQQISLRSVSILRVPQLVFPQLVFPTLSQDILSHQHYRNKFQDSSSQKYDGDGLAEVARTCCGYVQRWPPQTVRMKEYDQDTWLLSCTVSSASLLSWVLGVQESIDEQEASQKGDTVGADLL